MHNIEEKPTIWFNVTTSIHWNRPAVGIVRAELELLNGLKSVYGEGVKECVWHENAFFTKEEYLLLNRYAKKEVSHQSKGKKSPKFIQKWKNSCKKRKAKFEKFFSRLTRSYLKRKAMILHFLGRENSISRSTSTTDQQVTNKELLFKPNDIYLSVGCDWSYPIQDYLYSCHKNRVKIITACYDIIPILYPHYCLKEVKDVFPTYFLQNAEYSNVIVCDSKSAKKDLFSFLYEAGANIPTLKVIELGDNIISGNAVPSSEVADICRSKFILYVSTIERRKNHETLYKAYRILCMNGKAGNIPHLVFVGMKGWGVDDLMNDIKNDPLVSKHITILNNINDSDMLALYKNALFCVYPSYYEGWGLPVAEALALGKVVLASDSASIPEVGGDLVQYASPWNPEEWARKIEELSSNDTFRTGLEEKIRTSYRRRSWGETARQLAKIIDDIV